MLAIRLCLEGLPTLQMACSASGPFVMVCISFTQGSLMRRLLVMVIPLVLCSCHPLVMYSHARGSVRPIMCFERPCLSYTTQGSVVLLRVMSEPKNMSAGCVQNTSKTLAFLSR